MASFWKLTRVGARGVPPDQPRKGIIAAVSGERVFVDIGGKSEGVIPIAELSEPVHPGQEIQVTIAGWHVGRRSA